MPSLIDLLRRQQADGFPDVAGTEVAATIPLSERLLNEILAAQLPPSAAVSEVRVQARAANTFAVRVRLARAPFLPPIGLTLGIVRQPLLPHDPVLILQVAAGGLMTLAGPALRGLDVLPPEVRIDGDHLHVNIRTLLERRGLAELLRYLTDLRISTEEHRIVIAVRGRISIS